MKHQQRILTVTSLLLIGLMLAALACTGELTRESVQIGALPQYVCPSATPIPTDTPLPTSPPTYPGYFAANLSNYLVGDNISSVTVQWRGQSAGNIYVSYSGSMSVSPYYWSGASNVSIGDAPYGQPAVNGYYTIYIPFNVMNATVQVWAAGAGGTLTMSVIRFPGSVTQFYPPPYGGEAPPIHPTPRPTYTPYPTPTPYVRTNDYFLNDAIYTSPDEPLLNIRFRVTRMESLSFQGTPTPNPPKTPVPGSRPTAIYAESLYLWTFEIRNYSDQQTYTIYPPAQSFVATIILPNGEPQDVLLFPTYEAAQLAGMTDFTGYQAHNLAPGDAVTFQLAAKGPQGTLYRVSWAMDTSSRPVPVDPNAPTLIVAGNNVVSWINEVNTECVGEIAEPR